MFLSSTGRPAHVPDQRGIHARHAARAVPDRADRADARLRCMRIAVDEAGLDDEHRAQLWQYLQYAAISMMNADF
jgi:hemoglobin